MQNVKEQQKFLDALKVCNITSLYKHKGSHKDFMNYRGVFSLTLFLCALDRLIYNDLYSTINNSLTDGNVGARKEKKRNIRDNIFVLGAVINSVTNRRSFTSAISGCSKMF